MRKIFLMLALGMPLLLIGQVSRYNQFRGHKFMMEGVRMLSMGNVDHGMAELERALQYDPFNREVYQLRADFNSSRGQYENAVSDYSKAIELSPQNSLARAELFNSRGQAHERLSRMNEAFYDFERALQSFPDFPEAQGNYNRVGAQLGFNVDRVPPRGSENENRPGFYPGTGTDYPPLEYPPIDDPITTYPQTDYPYTNPNPNPTDPSNPYSPGVDPPTNKKYSYVYDNLYIGGTPVQNVQIDKIEVTRRETIVHLEVRHNGRGSMKITIDRPGSPKAFFIEDPYSPRRYRLREMRGFPTGFERRYKLRRGDILQFTLIFEPIPYDTRTINIKQGDSDNSRDKRKVWNFTEVELTKPLIRYEN